MCLYVGVKHKQVPQLMEDLVLANYYHLLLIILLAYK